MINSQRRFKQTQTVVCLDCEEEIQVDSQSKFGQVVTCIFCDARMRVIDTDPLQVGWADEDDFYDDDDDDDFEDFWLDDEDDSDDDDDDDDSWNDDL